MGLKEGPKEEKDLEDGLSEDGYAVDDDTDEISYPDVVQELGRVKARPYLIHHNAAASYHTDEGEEDVD